MRVLWSIGLTALLGGFLWIGFTLFDLSANNYTHWAYLSQNMPPEEQVTRMTASDAVRDMQLFAGDQAANCILPSVVMLVGGLILAFTGRPARKTSPDFAVAVGRDPDHA